MQKNEQILAQRLGMTVHVSPLRMKLRRLYLAFPSPSARDIEDWLIDVANERGARVVFRDSRPLHERVDIPEERLSQEELVVAICQLQCLDRPQMLRLAAQFISREVVNVDRLCLIARRERVGPVLAELAKQALRVDAKHRTWRQLAERFATEKPLRDSLLHWTRLAEPVMKNGRCNAEAWKLVA